MKHTLHILLAALTIFSLALSAADNIACAEPIINNPKIKEEADGFWGILETCLKSDDYTIVSRAALSQMMTEIGLSTTSDLLNLNAKQRANLGKLEGVKYIIISELSKFGTKYTCTLRVLESSTGVIDQKRTVKIRVNDLDELEDKLEPACAKLLNPDQQELRRSALLTPVITFANPGANLARDFNSYLAANLIQNGVALQNLSSVSKILADNNLGNLTELEPKLYMKVGKLLEVTFLLQAEISRFEIIGTPFQVAQTGAQGVIYTGNMSSTVKVVDTATGNIASIIPMELRINFNALGPQATLGWTYDDYAKYLVATAVQEKLLPALIQIPGLKNN